jgi:TOMM system kinase/cyclase fusion protein
MDRDDSEATIAGRRPADTVVAGRYRLLSEIGRGSMGKVYRVEHVHTGEAFAMKVLGAHVETDASMVERFKREARTPALIKSDHVVKVIDADVAPELGGAPFLVMELLDGVDLEKYSAHAGKLPAADVVRILGQVARALDRAHAIGVVHRDLKPANVFMHRREDGVVVKLLDFGISKLAPTGEAARITASGAIMGTPLYMPPEQALGRSEIRPAADIWSLGMLAYRLLTGQTYWSAHSVAELMAAIVRDPVSVPTARHSELPAEFDAWFLRSCDRSPDERWSSAGEQITALAAALGLSTHASGLPGSEPDKTLRSADEAARAIETVVDVLRSIPREPAPKAASASTSRPALEGERRHVTVLSLDMTLSSLSGEEVDPEDLRDVTADYHAACQAILGALGRPLTETLGDGVLVYFGYPVAQGDDAKRAVTVGLRIAEAAQRIHERVSRTLSVALSMRGGVHTGLVVTGDSSGAPAAKNLVGQVPQVASNLKRLAPANAIAISAATQRLVRGSFTCEPLDGQLGGTASGVFRVTGELDSGVGDSVDRGTTDLVGREVESALLMEKLQDLEGGTGHVVLLTGEAGIGKSSVLRAFKKSLVGGDFSWLDCRCSPYFHSTALHPVVELLKRLLELSTDDSPEERLLKLRAFLREHDAGKEALALIGSLLSLPLPDELAALNLSPQRQKEKTYAAIASLLLDLAKKQPVVMVVEDLHWADPSTLELLGTLVDEGPRTAMLLVLTARNEFGSPWGARGHIAQLNLSRLSKKRIEAMVRRISGGKALPEEVMQELCNKTDGVPLFVEEMTKNLLEASFLEDKGSHYALSRPLPALGIPGTLRDSLASRLDRLGAAKATAQLAATLGRDFDYDLLRAVATASDEELARDLRALVESELLYQRGTVPRARFTFKHILVQEAAYESLLKNARKDAHTKISSALVELRPELCASQPEVLAHHRAGAGQHLEAAGDLLRAGQHALQRSANVESITHLRRAIELCEAAPPSRARAAVESTLHTFLGVPLMMTKGYGAEEVEQAYAKALSLSAGEESSRLLPVLWGLWIFYHVRARYRTAYELSEKLMALAATTPDSNVQVAAHLAHGSTCLLTGRLEAARDNLEKCIRQYDPVHHRGHAYLFGQDSLTFARTMLSWVLWLQGHPDQAVRMGNDAIAWAEEVKHPNTLAFALGMTAALHQYRGDRKGAAQTSGELIAMAGEQGLLHWLSAGRIVHGWATSGPTTDDEGVPGMLEGRAVWAAIGARVADSHWDAMIAERHLDGGRKEDCDKLLAAMRAFVADSDERSFEPEIDRLEGELLLLEEGKEAEAEACFQRALDRARANGARSLMLRAATSLARVMTAGGRADDAQALLAPIWALFKEGHDTRDLVRAKGVLTGMFL